MTREMDSAEGENEMYIYSLPSLVLKQHYFSGEMFLLDGSFSRHAFEKQKRIMKCTNSVRFYCRAAHDRTVSTLGFKMDRSVSITSAQECVPTWQQHSPPCGSPPVATHSPA